MTAATDGDWSCSRCDSFGSIKPGEEPRCECDEYQESLESERDDLKREVVRMRPVYEAALVWFRAPHVRDSNCSAGDCDNCPARPAEQLLRIVIEAVTKNEVTT